MLNPPTLTHAVSGERFELLTAAGRVSVYRDGPGTLASGALPLPPLLLVHSINASGSAYEMAPLYEHYRHRRAVYALDLPGFGFSDRSERPYLPRLMTDAVLAVVNAIRAQQNAAAVDVAALSLAGEFAARAQVEQPGGIGRVALISPTGFSRSKRHYGPPGGNRGVLWLYRLLAQPLWAQWLFNTLTRPGSVRYFLQRTWGSKVIDEGLLRYDLLTTRQPGARHAPLYFLSAQLFSADINALYEAMTCPVWVSMATRGDFTDYQGISTLAGRANWQFRTVEGGALPYFEDLPGFVAALDAFWARQP